MKLTGLLFAAALLGACTQPAAEENYTRHVDPKIGTGGHGHVFVGANVPFGLVQVGPTSIPQTWDWCSGYHASDSTVIGFSHTHLSGTGIGDLFDVTVMPVTGDVTYARASFRTTDGEQVSLKVALSPVSVEGAKANLAAELSGWDFDATAKAADKAWNDELSKVKIETADETARRIFYTALYHTMIAPSLFCDVNGDYYGSDHAIHRNADFTNYTTFSLWDTYRAAMPLMTVLHPEKMADIVQTMLHISDEQGRLPVWHLWGNETDCMVGNPGIVAVADAIVKGIGGFDREKAFEAIRKTAMNPDRGNGLRMEYGYIPCEMFNEAVAYDMEYALADGAAARAAETLGKAEDAKYFEERSHSYRNYFDPQTGFMRGRDSKKGLSLIHISEPTRH